MYYPADQKFVPICSISYHLQDIFNVLFSAEIQDGHQKWRKLEFFPLGTGHFCTTLWVKKSLEIVLSLTVFEIFVIFHIFTKSSNKVAITHLYIEQ